MILVGPLQLSMFYVYSQDFQTPISNLAVLCQILQTSCYSIGQSLCFKKHASERFVPILSPFMSPGLKHFTSVSVKILVRGPQVNAKAVKSK